MPRVLWIATKAPWPPRDGGRLLQWLTLGALAAEGVEITLVAPVDPATEDPTEIERALEDRVHPVLVPDPPRRRLASWARALGTGLPWTAAAHDRPMVRRRVESLLAEASRGGAPYGAPFDVVHAEQVQSWPQTASARARGVGVVLRAQNVESDLWRQVSEMPGLLLPARALLRREARRLARWEGETVSGATAAIALTGEDAGRLSALAGGREVTPIAAPFPERLPAGEGTLDGRPALVLLGSGGWLPNRDSERWFLQQVWPEVFRAAPDARLHVFGGEAGEGKTLESAAGVAAGAAAGDAAGDEGVFRHPSPLDSREAFIPGSLVVVPVRIASGVRMKILEAWARGIPVLATPEAAAGLDATDGRELLLFRDTASLLGHLRRLEENPQRVEDLVRAARAKLRSDHAPQQVAGELLRRYRATIADSIP